MFLSSSFLKGRFNQICRLTNPGSRDLLSVNLLWYELVRERQQMLVLRLLIMSINTGKGPDDAFHRRPGTASRVGICMYNQYFVTRLSEYRIFIQDINI